VPPNPAAGVSPEDGLFIELEVVGLYVQGEMAVVDEVKPRERVLLLELVRWGILGRGRDDEGGGEDVSRVVEGGVPAGDGGFRY